MRYARALMITAVLLAACSGTAQTPTGAPTAAETAASATVAAPSATIAGCPTPADPATMLLTAADVADQFTVEAPKDANDLASADRQAALQERGFVSALRERLVSTSDPKVTMTSSAWVFKCATGGRSEFDATADPANACIDGSAPTIVDVEPVIGDASAALFCPAATVATSTAAAQLFVQVLLGANVFRLSYNGEAGSTGQIQGYVIGLARQVADRAGQ